MATATGFVIRFIPGAEKLLMSDRDVARDLREKAEKVRRKVRAHPRFDLSVRAGVGPRGAFSQVIMRGPGALTEEFGSRRVPPRAPLRSALRGTVK